MGSQEGEKSPAGLKIELKKKKKEVRKAEFKICSLPSHKIK